MNQAFYHIITGAVSSGAVITARPCEDPAWRGHTRGKTSQQFSLTRERIPQIKAKALRKA